VFDHIVETCSTADLIDEGLLAPIRLFRPPGPDLSGLGRKGADYDQEAASVVMGKPAVVGDALSHWKKLCHGRRGVAFCTSVANAEATARKWREAGYRAMAVSGGSDDADRREAIAGLRAGRLDLVACAQLWIAGVDVPEIDAVVWLRPTMSLTAWLQGNGRGLRIAPGKRDLIIVDHVGNSDPQRLGSPLIDHEWSLEGKAKRKDGEKAPSVKVCPSCFASMETRRSECPECGHVFTVERRELEHVDGELEEVDATELRRQAKREQGSAQTLEDLTAVGVRRGMKNPRGWARHVLAARQAKGQWGRVA
jgi:superfamily II DNA or RNA helicase